MRYINKYKIFESRKNTQEVISGIFNKLPDHFYFKVKYNADSNAVERNISTSIDEHANIVLTIIKLKEFLPQPLDDKEFKLNLTSIRRNKYSKFKFTDIQDKIQEFLQKLPNYSYTQYTGYIENNYTQIISKDKLNNNDFIKIQIQFNLDSIPNFKKKSTDEDIKDIFIEAFESWQTKFGVKESKDFYKLYTIIPTDGGPKPKIPNDNIIELKRSILMFESMKESKLISASIGFRNYEKTRIISSSLESKEYTEDLKVFNGVNSKDAFFEFIDNKEIIQFTLIFQKIIN